MGQTNPHTQQQKPGKPSAGGDAMRAFGITLLVHMLLIIVFGTIWIKQVELTPAQLYVALHEEELQSSEEESIASTLTRESVVRDIILPSVPTVSIPWQELAVDSISDIQLPDDNFEVASRWEKTIGAGFQLKSAQSGSGDLDGVPNSEKGKVAVSGWTGIRITMDLATRLPRISGIVKGGPAYRDGVLGITNYGDYIISVDGQVTANRTLAEVRDLIVGEAGSVVKLGLCKYPGAMVTHVNVRRGR